MATDDDHVYITTRDIYQLASQTAAKVDAVLSMVTAAQTTDADHESRIRRLEARFFGIVGTIGLAAASLIVYAIATFEHGGV